MNQFPSVPGSPSEVLAESECNDSAPSSRTTHGMSKTKIYKVWHAMLQRCLNPRHPYYYRYGGRGITVCRDWMKVESFIRDMGTPAPGLSIDRINNDGNYEPGNCRWATRHQQLRNTVKVEWFTFQGVRKTIPEWASIIGITRKALKLRLRDWPLEQAMMFPPLGKKQRFNNLDLLPANADEFWKRVELATKLLESGERRQSK